MKKRRLIFTYEEVGCLTESQYEMLSDIIKRRHQIDNIKMFLSIPINPEKNWMYEYFKDYITKTI